MPTVSRATPSLTNVLGVPWVGSLNIFVKRGVTWGTVGICKHWQDTMREPKVGTTSATLVPILLSLIMSCQLGVVCRCLWCPQREVSPPTSTVVNTAAGAHAYVLNPIRGWRVPAWVTFTWTHQPAKVNSLYSHGHTHINSSAY